VPDSELNKSLIRSLKQKESKSLTFKKLRIEHRRIQKTGSTVKAPGISLGLVFLSETMKNSFNQVFHFRADPFIL
jgi:hypothetical protein